MDAMLTCPVCDNDALYVLGTLGSTTHYRCRACGANGAAVTEAPAPSTDDEPTHCHGGGAASSGGGCHAGEPVEVAFCECSCTGCAA